MNDPRQWTDPQRAAIAHGDGDLLVSAAAGSGKTAVLAERCARLVCEGACGIDNLLVLTFTEAAAMEMKGRITEALAEKLRGRRGGEESVRLRREAAVVDRAAISTLHAFCSRVLRQHFAAADIDPAFEVMDEDEARLLREETAAEVIARWHTTPRAGCDFPAFFEAYSQGNDGDLAAMMLRVHHMLSSVADPAGYLKAARAVYGEGAAAMVDHWARVVAMGQVRVERMRAQRAAADAARAIGPGQVASEVMRAAQMLAWAEAEIARTGIGAIAAARDALAYKWPACKTLKEVPDFEKVKKRTWEKVRDGMKKLCAETLAADAAAMVAEMKKLGPSLEVLLALVEDFTAAYTLAKRNGGGARLDFADLERLTHTLLTGGSDGGRMAARELRGRFSHVLVDEFQDINPLQAALLDAVTPSIAEGGDAVPSRGGLFVVGDVKQSIYGFRLAEPALFLERERRALASDRAVPNERRAHVWLPHNFRSAAPLIEVMNVVFERVMTLEIAGVAYGEGHALLPAPERAMAAADDALLTGVPVEVRLVGMKTDDGDDEGADHLPEEAGENLSAVEEEARLVARRIEALMAEKRTIRAKDGTLRPLMHKDIAILLRAMKNKAMIFARALAGRGIPAHADLSTGYFETAEVREVLALLHVLDNPRQDIPLATAMLGPFGRFTHNDLAIIRLTYDRDRVTFAEAAARYARDAGIESADHAPGHPPASAELAVRLDLFWEQLARWRGRLRTSPLHEGLAAIYAESTIIPYVSGLEAGAQRVANLQALHQRALKFGSFRKQGLHRFLRFIERLRDGEGDFGEAPVLSEASDVVRIMSVHKSKGLEFPVVIVSGLGGKLRLQENGPVLVHRDLGVGLSIADLGRNIYYPSATVLCIREAAKRAAVAEELRLLYVAMTRAREHLILTGHVKDEEEVRALRSVCEEHAGGLPEDVLLKAARPLQWVLGAVGGCPMNVRWPWQGGDQATQVQVTLERPEGGRPAAEAEQAQGDELVRRLLACEPLDIAPPQEQAVVHAVRRVTGVYGHAEMTRRPAVMTVSALKAEVAEDEGAARAPMRGTGGLAAEAARNRGTATHRVLELLDFTQCDRAALVAEAIGHLVASELLGAEEAKLADADGIAWMVTTDTGKRIIAAAKRVKALDRALKLKRELPFAWAGRVYGATAAQHPADLPTIRGVMDLLIVDTKNRTAEIIDYKTDSDWTWEAHLAGYREQMGYYLRAASEILGFPVARATLLFLGPHKEVEVTAAQDLSEASHAISGG